MKIYTRKGDDGTTGLWYGGRVAKAHPRTEAYGTVDEACAAIGVARATAVDPEVKETLLRLQRELFVAGAELATAPAAADRLEDEVSRVTAAMVAAIEVDIDRYMARVDLPPKFVIPGGTALSAHLDVARTVLRRAERAVVALRASGEGVEGTVIEYLNRASDLLFALARHTDEPAPKLFEGRG